MPVPASQKIDVDDWSFDFGRERIRSHYLLSLCFRRIIFVRVVVPKRCKMFMEKFILTFFQFALFATNLPDASESIRIAVLC